MMLKENEFFLYFILFHIKFEKLKHLYDVLAE